MKYATLKFAQISFKSQLVKMSSLVLATTCLAAANADPVRYTLRGVTTQNGMASGMFYYDSFTNEYSNIEIDLVGASGNFTYTGVVPNAPHSSSFVQFVVDPQGDLTGRRLLTLHFETDLIFHVRDSNIISGDSGLSFQAVCGTPTCDEYVQPYDFVNAGLLTQKQTWHLTDFTTDTGAIINGSFDFDHWHPAYSAINFTVTSGSSVTSYNMIYPSYEREFRWVSTLSGIAPDMSNETTLFFELETPLTAAGGTINILPYPAGLSFQANCDVFCSPQSIVSDGITSGRIRTLGLAPDFVTDANLTVAENQTAVLDIESQDDLNSEGNGLTYSKNGGSDEALFILDADTGVLTFISAPNFAAPSDANADNVYELQVSVTDLNGRSALQDLFITVMPVANIVLPIGDISFGTLSPFAPPSVEGVILGSNGNADLEILSVSIFSASPTGFSLSDDNACVGIVSAGSDCNVPLIFDPSVDPGPGLKTAILTVTSNDPDRPNSGILLNATIEVGELVVPATLDFGSVPLAQTGTAVVTVTVTGPMQFEIVELDDPFERYTYSSNCPTQFASAGSCEISIFFTPDELGLHEARLVVESIDANNPQIDIVISGQGVQAVDTDADGVLDFNDNCTLISNSDQRDSDGDGFGNMCDADLSGDGVVNVTDLGLLRLRFFTTDADADLNGDGVVNVVDLGIMRAGFFQPPGPAGIVF